MILIDDVFSLTNVHSTASIGVTSNGCVPAGCPLIVQTTETSLHPACDASVTVYVPAVSSSCVSIAMKSPLPSSTVRIDGVDAVGPDIVKSNVPSKPPDCFMILIDDVFSLMNSHVTSAIGSIVTSTEPDAPTAIVCCPSVHSTDTNLQPDGGSISDKV